MSFVLSHDEPLMRSALAVGVGTAEGRALVDRAIYEREAKINEEARVRADERLYGDPNARPVYDRPYVRQPRSGQQGANGNGYGGTGQARPATEYQQGQLALEKERLEMQRAKQEATPQMTPYQEVQVGQEERRFNYQQQKDQDKTAIDGMNAVGNIGRGVGKAVDAFGNMIGRAMGNGPPGKPAKPLKTPTQHAAARKSTGVPKRDAAATLVGTLPAQEIARLIAPAFGGVVDPATGRMLPPDPTAFAMATNLIQALEQMPMEQAPDGKALYSLQDLGERFQNLVAAGVRPQVLEPLSRGIESLTRRVRAATQQVELEVPKILNEAAQRGLDPATTRAMVEHAAAQVAETLGMSLEQFNESSAWLDGLQNIGQPAR